MFTTHSANSNTFPCVFFVCSVLPERAGEKISVGGLEPNTLKKLNGARLILPALSMVLTKAMGRGATALNKYSCNLWPGTSPGLTFSIQVVFYNIMKLLR